jgi:pimeloyl-ACP methyl ester carboxylesterase
MSQSSFLRFFRLSALVAALSVTGSSWADRAIAQAPRDFGPAWESVDCTEFDVPALVAALSDCGYVTVPERHGQPDGPTIELAVVRTRSIGDNPAPDPLLLGQGGPGASAIAVFVNQGIVLLPQMSALLTSRDLITIEQRGTLYSRPYLFCSEEAAHNIAVARGEEAAEDTGWIVACRDRLLAEGINFDAYNSVENAADFYTVAEVLGYDQFNYYGGSYGTLLGQYIMAQADEHTAQLHSVIIDGVLIPDVDFNLDVTYTESLALRNVFAECRQDEQCNQAYPDLETVFLTLHAQLNQNPVPITLTAPDTGETIASTLDGTGLAEAIMPYLYNTEGSSLLPRELYRAQAGDFKWAEEQLSNGLSTTEARGMYHAVLCSQTNSPEFDPSDLFPAPYDALLPIGMEASEDVRRFCDLLAVEQQDAFAYDNTEIPTLLFSGEYDPVTPEPYAQVVASNLETAYTYTFPAMGHVVLGSPADRPAAECFTDITLAFLAEPDQTPDSRCLAEVKPVFVVEED